MVGEPLVGHHPARAIGGEPKLCDFGLGGTKRSADERHPVLACLGCRSKALVKALKRVVPAHRLERSALGALLWTWQAVGIVDLLQRRLTAGACRALADRVGGITLQLDHPA